MSLSILIIDDEPHLPHQLARFLKKRGYEVYTAADSLSGLRELQHNPIDLVLLDLRLPGLSGLEVLQQIRTMDAELPVVILTAHGDVQTAVKAMKLGASDYLLKGFDLEELLLVVQRALETSAMSRELRQLRQERSDNYHFSHIVGQSERMRAVFALVDKVARSDASVLIMGESGTGKEVVARAIHEQSSRSSGPFHPLNCAAIAQNLLESELFGYEQYAFTDAKKQKRGLLELAEGGTLFLDEIGEMPLDMQAKLLRVLETRSFFRLGGNKEVRINVRVLAATNRDLEQAMKEGLFRSDLYYRLAVLKITLPPLRERPGDILLLAARFIEEFNRSLGRNVHKISPEAQQLLLRYSWPGNVRELKNVIERAMILSSSDELLPAHLPQEIVGNEKQRPASSLDPWDQWLNSHPLGAVSLEKITEQIEQHFIRWALEMTKHNRTRAAELLGFAKVDQLRYLMRKHGIE
ncbi:DNA-binding NtrC family response regulator [Thermosporothrix hazakensis]|jgi:DNA-binding NtrC family response regulator|uniref:DNA-binding NtrC family response regulator n=1 Tax=Thermosporothrix hazakensis TaxID=644383 RepID=A0A326U8W6_THEHA|nr:sigma-54 dependent transcriptional regulator [Thermosporothrix hazakensis]PZW30492.1 DNA-binding NtrC family response regulator [Thermosporothrix hazakensis]GCE49352.1 acetoacetate metabolism regulatory protein AtoC [Thermosporothrix hazakensis]